MSAEINASQLRQVVLDAGEIINAGVRTVEPYLQRGAALLRLGRVESALADLDVAVLIDPNLADVRVFRAEALVSLGRNDAALQDLQLAIELDQLRPEAWLLRGNTRFNLGDYRGAASDCSRALDINAESPAIWLLRGRGRHQLACFDDAIQDLRQAATLAPDDTETHYWLGMALRDAGHNEPAVAAFTNVISINDRHTAAYVSRGKANAALGNMPAARSDWTLAGQMLHHSH